MNNNSDPVDLYLNLAQALANIIDCNKLFVAAGRGTGKTTEITAPRMLRVADTMPRETSVIAHKSYVALFTNVIPAILSAFNQEIKLPDGTTRPRLREGLDYVVGEKDLPSHFKTPRYPRLYPERSIVFANGHYCQAVAIDRPDTIAGMSVVHVLCEEMKYVNAEKFRSRVVPAIRTSRIGAGSEAHKSWLHGGITGVSDIGRVSIGESNWFSEYEKDVDPQLISDIVSLALQINKILIRQQAGKPTLYERTLDQWQQLLCDLRKSATYYLRVSTFVNRDVLGFDYFKTQQQVLSSSEFLSAICSIGDRSRDNLFFELWDEDKHTYDDSYKYAILDKLSLKDTFTIDGTYLKHYVPSEKILLGYDPGSFASMVAAQYDPAKDNTLRVMKEFFVWPPKGHEDLAYQFNAFFSPAAKNRNIDLYYDRAGNKHNAKLSMETDARELKSKLESYGWRVTLKNIGQGDIYYWQHHRLWKRLLAENEPKVPKIRIDSNECENLVSAMYCCKKVPGSSPVELDKSPEKKVRIDLQAGLTPQIPSALTYLVWGLFSKWMPGVHTSSFSGGLSSL